MGADRHGPLLGGLPMVAERTAAIWQMYVRHTAAVGLGLAHLDNIVRHTEEINRPQALNEVLRSLQAREHPLVPKGTASRRLSLAPSVSVSLSLECLGVCGCT